jgi:glycosyltransferase involved in cell wall biosynthesis
VKISYAITTHNEWQEVDWLLSLLLENKDDEDEIVIVDDYSDQFMKKVFDVYAYDIKLYEHALDNNFAAHKNFMNDQCTGDWIFNIDADERPHENLIQNIKQLIAANPTVELFWVPRINLVDGITDEHIRLWNWRVNERGWINYPDPQQRIYKNAKHIKWEKPVHERLVGAKVDTGLPQEEEWSYYHPKTIVKQEKQNEKYAEIIGR